MVALVSLELAKQHLGLEEDESDLDDLIEGYIESAKAFVESYTGLVLDPDLGDDQVHQQAFEAFTPALRLYAWPIRSIVSVAYIDAAGTNQTLTAEKYRLAAVQRPARLSSAVGTCWPGTHPDGGLDSVVITFKAGFDDGAVPPAINAAILMIVDHLNRNRSSVEVGERAAAVEVPMGVRDLLAAWRMVSL